MNLLLPNRQYPEGGVKSLLQVLYFATISANLAGSVNLS